MPTGRSRSDKGNIGDGARVAIGENISWTEGLTSEQFERLSQQVDKSIGDRSPRIIPVSGELAPPGYVDRPELTDRLLEDLLSEEQAPKGRATICAVHGLGGIGKTTVARSLIWRPEIESRFPDGRIWITLGQEPPEANSVINDCASQLDATLKTKATAEAARADLAAQLQEKSVLIVIDDVWPGKSVDVAKALMVASPRSRFLLTTRFPRISNDPEIKAKNFPLSEMAPAQAIQLIAGVLDRECSTEEMPLVNRLCEIVGGHPLALELAAARVKEGRPWKMLLDDLAAEVARLEALEETEDDAFAMFIGTDSRKRRTSVRASLLLSVRYLSREAQRLLAWLGVAAEDAIIAPQMAATLWSIEEGDATKHLRTLSDVGLLNRKAGGYSIHDLMHDIARELLTKPEAAQREGDIPGFGLSLLAATQQFLNRHRARTSNNLWHTLPDDGYIHHYLASHFEQADWGVELKNLLWEESVDGRCGWYQARERLGQTIGFLADVDRAWHYADRITASDTSLEFKGGAIALQLHCALLTTSINSLSAAIPPYVLARATRCGILALPSALAFIRYNHNPQGRLDALLALAREKQLPSEPRVIQEALATAHSLNGYLRVKALAELAPLFRCELPDLLAEALNTARNIEDASLRATGLSEVARRLPPHQALIIARSIDDHAARARALAEVALRLPVEDAAALALEIEDLESRGMVLAQVVSRLPAEEALLVARGIELSEWRVRALADVIPRLLPGAQMNVRSEALSIALEIDYRENKPGRARALAAIARCLPAEELPAVFDKALSAAKTGRYNTLLHPETVYSLIELFPVQLALEIAKMIPDERDRALAKLDVSRRLPAEDRSSLLSSILTEVRSIGDQWQRAEALAEVAAELPTEEQLSVIGEALRDALCIGDNLARDQALAEVAERLPPAEAFEVAVGLSDERTRNKALASVAQRLPIEEAVTAIRDISHWAKSEPLVQLAERLPPEDALALARSIVHPSDRAEALAEVVPRLRAEVQAGVIQETLSAAREEEHPAARARTFAAVARRLPPQERLSVLNEAFRVALSKVDSSFRASVFADIARTLPPEEAVAAAQNIHEEDVRAEILARVLDEVGDGIPAEQALVAARSIASEPQRSRALTGVARHLSAERALAVAYEIGDEQQRAGALAQVALRLPAERGLAVAQRIDHKSERAWALSEVASRLQSDARLGALSEALSVARTIDDPGQRALDLSAIAGRLMPNDQSCVFEEALSAAKSVDNETHRSVLLENIVPVLPIKKALDVAREIESENVRDRTLGALALRLPTESALEVAQEIGPAALREVAERLAADQTRNLSALRLAEAVRALSNGSRRKCLLVLVAMLPLIAATGGETGVGGFKRSINSVYRWWP